MERYSIWFVGSWIGCLLSTISYGLNFTNSCSGHNTRFCVPTIFVILIVCATNMTAALDSDLCRNDTISFPSRVVFQNELISLICNSNDYNSLDMYFERSGQPLTEYTNILNTTAIQLNYPVTDDLLKNLRRLNFNCAIRVNGKRTCIGNRRVTIDYYPKRATNIQCRIYNWEYMRCWWDLGVEYNHPNTVSVVCNYATTEKYSTTFLSKEITDSFWRACPQLDKTSCTWDRNTFTDPYKQIHLLINVTNTLRPEATVSVEKTILTDTIIQIDEIPRDAIVISETDDPYCLTLRWPAAARYKKILYQITYNSPCQGLTKLVKSVLYDKTDGFVGIKLCDIHSYAVYQFNIKGVFLKVIDKKQIPTGYWSKETLFTYKTSKKEAPSRSPQVIAGLYEHLLEPAHNVKIYWKPLGQCEMNSDKDSVHYLITIDSSHKSPEVIEHPLFYTKLAVPDDEVVTATLQARNDIAETKEITQMAIYPRNVDMIASSLTITFFQRSHLHPVHAKIEKLIDVSLNHTLVWCKGTEVCENYPDWEKLPSDVFETTLPLTNEYRFGLITEYNRHGISYNTGIVWEKCLYEKGKVPATAPRGVHKSDVQLPESFRLEWRHHECTEGYFNYYQLTYCQAEEEPSCSCKDNEVHIKIPKQETSYTVRDLQAGTNVCAWLNGVSGGVDGPSSSQVFFEIQAKSFSPWIWIGPILAVIVLVGVGILFYMLWRRYRRRLRDVTRIEDVALVDQSGNPLIEITSLTNRDKSEEESDDSGTSSMSAQTGTVNTDNRNLHNSGNACRQTRHYDSLSSNNIDSHRHSDHREPENRSGDNRHHHTETTPLVMHSEQTQSNQSVRELSLANQLESTCDNTLCGYSDLSDIGLASYQKAQNCSFGDIDIDSYSKVGIQAEICDSNNENINLNNSQLDSNNDATQNLVPNVPSPKPKIIMEAENEVLTNVSKHSKTKSGILTNIDEDEDTNLEYNLQDISDILDVEP